ELRAAEAELRLAELETMRARINYTNELPSFRIVAAEKSAPQGGPVTVGLELLELPQAFRGGVRQYLVSLRDARSLIGEPYQASLIIRGVEGRRHRVTFRLLRDTDEVTVVIVSGTRREEVPVILQRGGREDSIVVRAQNFSQEAALDD
ncbi:MAG: hypothetical protein KJ062_03475, partial [Thermoanaerobaculia bacterium]|nr:hypothetical protein [Thermoanaerobaculia bacterium]